MNAARRQSQKKFDFVAGLFLREFSGVLVERKIQTRNGKSSLVWSPVNPSTWQGRALYKEQQFMNIGTAIKKKTTKILEDKTKIEIETIDLNFSIPWIGKHNFTGWPNERKESDEDASFKIYVNGWSIGSLKDAVSQNSGKNFFKGNLFAPWAKNNRLYFNIVENDKSQFIIMANDDQFQTSGGTEAATY